MMQFLGVMFVFLSLGYAANAWAQSDMNAIKSLKFLEAQTKLGPSYDDYSKELAHTKSTVNFFKQSPDAKNKVKLTEAIKRALDHYEFAKLVWERAKKRSEMESELARMNPPLEGNPIKKRKARMESLKKLQEAERLRSMGKSAYYLDKIKDSDILQKISARYLNNFMITKQKTFVNEILPIIWRQASYEVKNAATAVRKEIQTVKETDSDDNLEEDILFTEDRPAPQPTRARRIMRKAVKPPAAPPEPTKESSEALPVAGSVMPMISPGTKDQD